MNIYLNIQIREFFSFFLCVFVQKDAVATPSKSHNQVTEKKRSGTRGKNRRVKESQRKRVKVTVKMLEGSCSPSHTLSNLELKHNQRHGNYSH